MSLSQSIVNLIKQFYPLFTDVEKLIATDILEHNYDVEELSAQSMIDRLHISKAALTRFAKKCEFQGYREFVFFYSSQEKNSVNSKKTDNHYNDIVQAYIKLIEDQKQLIDHNQMKIVNCLLENAKRIYFFGVGSSGLVARELKLRLTRLGLVCEALTEQESFTWTLNIIDSDCLIFGISLSGETDSILKSLTKAYQLGAKTILITGNPNVNLECHQILTVASLPNLQTGQFISPQFPFLIITDIIYKHYLENKPEEKTAQFQHFVENEHLSN